MSNLTLQLRLLALGAFLCQSAGATPIITGVVETGGDNEPTDTITAKWTGTTFPISVAGEPVPGAVIGNTYTVGVFGNGAPAFVDRNHRYTNATNNVTIPAYLVEQEYIMSGNDNRDNASYTLDVTVDRPVDVYMLIDNRLGDPNGSNADPPSFGPTKMQWILDEGWVASSTGANRVRDINLPDEVGIDEGADGTINQWYSVYRKSFPAGTFQLKQADNTGQNMYGVVVTPAAPGRVVTVNTVNNDSPGAGETSLQQALTGLQDGDIIRFNIPGDGPHTIVTPLGGYPLITANNVTIDGYSQPGGAPNTNPILGGNNAQIQIVLDSTGADTAPNPINPALPLRRSTRLDFPNDVGNTGYGTSENCILGLYQSDNSTIRGLSFLARRTPGSDDDPSIYAVALIREATNAHVQGCWFGIAPGATTINDVKPPASAVAAFRWRIGGDIYSAGAIIGTDGDGVADRTEFNVMLGGRITLALELPGPKIAGNYFNVFPNGTSFLDVDASYQLWANAFIAGGSDPGDVSIENIENGRVTDNTIIGTDGDGVSDSDERNIFNHVVYSHEIELYSAANNLVVAGNYFCVGVDGVTTGTASTNISPNLIELPGTASVRVGSNGDGISDSLEGNLIVSLPGSRFVVTGGSSPIVSRLNSMVNDNFKAVPFADGENGAYLTYYAPYLADVAGGAVPALRGLTNGVLSGTFPAPNASYPNVIVDIYTADPASLAKTNYWPLPMVLPLTYLTSITDNGTGDLDPTVNAFRVDLSSFGLSTNTYYTAAASYSQSATSFTGTNAITSPMSNPLSATARMSVRETAPKQLELSWIAPEGYFEPQWIAGFGTGDSWFPVPGTPEYYNGRNIARMSLDVFTETYFFKLAPK